MSVKKLHCPTLIHLLKPWMACLNILEIEPGSLVRQATGVISKPTVLEHVHMRKIACHAQSQLLLLQTITLKLDSVLYGFANSRIMLCTAAE